MIKKIGIITFLTVFLFSAMVIQPKQKASAVWGVVVPIATEIGASYLMNKFYNSGSSALKPDFDEFVEDTWNKQTAADRANEAWNMNNYERNPKKPGWGRWAVPVAIASTFFTLAGDSLKSEPVFDFETLTGTKQTLDGNALNFVIYLYSGSSSYRIKQPDGWPSTSPYGFTYSGGQPYVRYTEVWKTVESGINKLNVGLSVTGAGYLTWKFDEGTFSIPEKSNPFADKFRPKEGVSPESDSSTFTSDSGEEMIYVETPDPTTRPDGLTQEDFDKMIASDPVTEYNPEDYVQETSEPTTKPIESDWWKWLLTPLEKILELLKELFDWLKQTFSQLPEWISSILSKLADLLSQLGLWFSDLIGSLGNWFSQLWDKLAELLSSLGMWFQSLFDQLGQLALDLWAWLSQLLEAVLNLPQKLIDLLVELFVPAVPVGDLFIPVMDDIKLKFNPMGDFAWLAPAWNEGACPKDLYASFFGNEVRVVRFDIVCDLAKWWKPILSGFLWFMFGWWAIRKTNTLMAKRGGAL